MITGVPVHHEPLGGRGRGSRGPAAAQQVHQGQTVGISTVSTQLITYANFMT